MVLLVPFDDSALSRTALARAAEFGDLLDEDIVALAVIPSDVEYARERGWIGPDEPFDEERICRGLRVAAESIASDVTVRCESAQMDDERASQTTGVVRAIRAVAAELDPSIVFVGSENAGRVAAPLSSVGSPVSEDARYDVHIVRHATDV